MTRGLDRPRRKRSYRLKLKSSCVTWADDLNKAKRLPTAAPPLFNISSSEEDSAQHRTLNKDRSFRAVFLAAKAADTSVIFVRRRPGLIPGVPVNSFRLNRTHPDANATLVAFSFVNNRLLAYPIFDKAPQPATGAGRRRTSNHFETPVKE